jgi:hypothetical protein
VITPRLRNWFASSLFTTLLGMAAPSYAALIPVDAGFGPGSGTLDTDTGLIFLDVGFTAGLSYADIHGVPADYFFPGSPATPGMLGPAQTFAGFHYATSAEVQGLFANAAVINAGPLTAGDEANFTSLITMLGIAAIDVSGTGDVLAYRAITADPGVLPQSRQIGELVIDRLLDPLTSSIFASFSGALGDEQVADFATPPSDGRGVRAAGSWLVMQQASPLPVPGTLWLALCGCAVLIWARGRGTPG